MIKIENIESMVLLIRGQRVILDSDIASIYSVETKRVNEAVRLMDNNSGLKVAVDGHTDSVGSDAYNQSLSERRAASVRDYLVGKGLGLLQLDAPTDVPPVG